MRYMQITGTHNGASIQLIVVVVVVLIKVRHHQLRQKKREKRERVNGNQTQSLRKWSAQSVRCRQGEDANCSNCDAVTFPVGQLTTDHTCWFFNGKPLELHAKKSLIIPNWPQVKSIDWQQWQVMAGKNTHHVQQQHWNAQGAITDTDVCLLSNQRRTWLTKEVDPECNEDFNYEKIRDNLCGLWVAVAAAAAVSFSLADWLQTAFLLPPRSLPNQCRRQNRR